MTRAKQAHGHGRLGVVFVLAVLTAAGTASAELIISNWTAADGDWDNPDNWAPLIVPHNGANTFDVYIGHEASSVVVALDRIATIDSLTVDASDVLAFQPQKTLEIVGGSIVNAGVISLNHAGAGNTTAFIGGDGVTLSGGGTVALGNNFGNVIRGTVGTERLTNNDNTIQGSGQIGGNLLLSLTNHGLIDANQSTRLVIASNDDGVINTGTMRASDGGELGLHFNDIQNSGAAGGVDGLIEALDGSLVELFDTYVIGGNVAVVDAGELEVEFSVIRGGVLNNSGAGIIRVPTDRWGQLGGVVNNPLGGRIIVERNAQLYLEGTGTHSNAGDISLNQTGGGASTLYLTSGDLTLTGGGTVTMSDDIGNVFRGSTGTERLINEDNTIQGSGQIGDAMSLTNNGLIDANQSTRLVIASNDDGVINTGTMRASDGGKLDLHFSDIQNSGGADGVDGLIEALDGSLVELFDTYVIGGNVAVVDAGELEVEFSVIRGGVLNNSGAGIIRVPTNRWGQLGGVVNNPLGGRIIVEQNAQLYLEGTGTHSNAGDISLNQTGGGASTLYLTSGDLTLTGGGTVTMSDDIGNVIRGSAGTERLINENNTIQGSGQIGDAMSLTNNGLIDANQATRLVVVSNDDGVINTGTMRASDGGKLDLHFSDIQNSGSADGVDGLIEALDGSLVELFDTYVIGGNVAVVDAGELEVEHSVIRGGVLNNSGAGIIRVPTNRWGQLGGVVNNPLGGRIIVEQNAQLYLEGTGTHSNAGDISLNQTGGGASTLYLTSGDVTLTGGGTVTMSDSTGNVIRGSTGTERLINEDNTIHGAGQICGVVVMSLTNRGVIDANGTSRLTIAPNADGFDNQGALRVTGAGGMHISFNPFTTSGDVFVAAGSKLTRTQLQYVQTAGRTTIDGELEVSFGNVDLQGGSLGGPGLVDADVDNVGGTVEPGASAGVMTIEGAYTQHADGILAIELGGLVPGTDHDQLAVSGAADLDGGLVVSLVDAFVPVIGNDFVILTGNAVTGSFTCTEFPALETGRFEIRYEEADVTLSVVAGAHRPADINADGVVNFGDLLLVLGGWGPCGACCAADATGDGVVSFGDILAVLGDWG